MITACHTREKDMFKRTENSYVHWARLARTHHLHHRVRRFVSFPHFHVSRLSRLYLVSPFRRSSCQSKGTCKYNEANNYGYPGRSRRYTERWRLKTVRWMENVRVPNQVSLDYNFARDFRWPKFPQHLKSYNLLDFYNYREAYEEFEKFAYWRLQEAEVVDQTDMSARIGLRGAFEMLVNFEGKTEKEMMNFHESWYQLVERYSVRNFKREDEDKLSAMEGIAYFIGIKANFNFVAGLWKEVLLFNLLWVLHEDVPKPRPNRSQPTWSWASVKGKISHRPKKRVQYSEPTQLSPLIERNIPCPPKETSTQPSETEWEEIKIMVSNEDTQVLQSNFVLELTGHLVEFDHQKVIFYPDVESRDTTSRLLCLPILSLKSAQRHGLKHQYQLRGIVLQLDPLGTGMFRRVGYFWTKNRSVERKAFESTQERVRII